MCLTDSMKSQTIVLLSVLGLWCVHSAQAHDIASLEGPQPSKVKRKVDLKLLEHKPDLPVSEISIDRQEELPKRVKNGSTETIYFKYREADCCSCWVSPDICGGGFYVRTVERCVARSWIPLSKNTFPVKVRLRVALKGSMSDIKITECINKSELKTIKESLKKASPFPALPALGSPAMVEMEFRFRENPKVIEERRFSETPLGVCLNTIQTEARRRFKNPFTRINPKVIIRFDVSENGEFGNFSIEKLSGQKEFDSQMVETLQQIKQVPLLEGFPKGVSAKICFDAKSPVKVYIQEVRYNLNTPPQ